MNERIHLVQLLALHMKNPMSPSHIIGSYLEFLNVNWAVSVAYQCQTKRRSHEKFWTLKFNGKGDSHALNLKKKEMKCEHLKYMGGKERPSEV